MHKWFLSAEGKRVQEHNGDRLLFSATKLVRDPSRGAWRAGTFPILVPWSFP